MKKKEKRYFLVSEIQRFYDEFERVPVTKDFEKRKGYPSRKTFNNHFYSFNTAVRLAGFEPINSSHKELNLLYTRDYLLKLITSFIEESGKTPTMIDIDKTQGREMKNYYRRHFGSWTKALEYLGLELNSVLKHEDDFLESEFHRFVEENGRVPRLYEFNKSEYPSFWCYQSRFGSWNKTVMHYGYKTNDSHRKYYIDDEICNSRYEYDISKWLLLEGVKYVRDVPYGDFMRGYEGKMTCDYKIINGDEAWYVEMIGFLNHMDEDRFSSEELRYYQTYQQKKKMLENSGLNYLLIHAKDIKTKDMKDIFYFLR